MLLPRRSSFMVSLPHLPFLMMSRKRYIFVWSSYNGKSVPNTTLLGYLDVTASNLLSIMVMSSAAHPCNAEQSVYTFSC